MYRRVTVCVFGAAVSVSLLVVARPAAVAAPRAPISVVVDPAEPPITSCLVLTIPTNEVNTVLDIEGGFITLSWLDEATSAEKAVRVLYADPACLANSAVGPHIVYAQELNASVKADTCADLREVIGGTAPNPTHSGGTFSLAGAQQYVANNC